MSRCFLGILGQGYERHQNSMCVSASWVEPSGFVTRWLRISAFLRIRLDPATVVFMQILFLWNQEPDEPEYRVLSQGMVIKVQVCLERWFVSFHSDTQILMGSES